MEIKVVRLNNVIDIYTYSKKKLINMKNFALLTVMTLENEYCGRIINFMIIT